MKILIADKFPNQYLPEISQLGHDVDFKPNLTAENLVQEIKNVNCLIVRSTKVSAEVIEASNSLSIIIRAGAGYNTIDVKSASKKGIFVCNTPGKNAIAVAELAMSLLLSIDRNIADNVVDLRKGKWNKKKYSTADGLFGKNAAIIGTGEIGLAFAERLAVFGVQINILAKKRSALTEKRLNSCSAIEFKNIDSLLQNSDIISLHVPSNSKTRQMVNKNFFNSMKDDAILINTSRGDIIDDHAFLDALDKTNLRAGLDVYNNEPASSQGEFNSAIAKHSSVYGTHHIGASTEQAQNAIAAEVVEILKQINKGEILHAVNIETSAPIQSTLTIRHYDKIGVLASILTILKHAKINVEDMENKIFQGSFAACATLRLDKKLNKNILLNLLELDDVIEVKQS